MTTVLEYRKHIEPVLTLITEENNMDLAKTINHFVLPKEMEALHKGLTLSWRKQFKKVDIFEWVNSSNQQQNIGDEADYLMLFMRIAEAIYNNNSEQFGKYMVASNMGGKRIYVKEFTPQDKEKYRYPYTSLLRSSKELDENELPGGFSFYTEISLEKADNPYFETQARKVARMLDGDDKEGWMNIINEKLDFLKIDSFIFSLQKIHSWGFQSIKPDGVLEDNQHLVREKRPKPRGAKLK